MDGLQITASLAHHGSGRVSGSNMGSRSIDRSSSMFTTNDEDQTDSALASVMNLGAKIDPSASGLVREDTDKEAGLTSIRPEKILESLHCMERAVLCLP